MSHNKEKVKETVSAFLAKEGISLEDIDRQLALKIIDAETVKAILKELNLLAERKQIDFTAKDRNKLLRQKQALETRYGDGDGAEVISVASIGGYAAFGGQIDFHNSPARFRTVIAGVRGGKTFSGAYETLRFALEEDGRVIWVCAPTFKMVKVAEMEIENLLTGIEEVVVDRNKKDMKITLISGSTIQFHSLENYDALRGYKVDAIWVDEASYARKEAIDVLRTRISSTMGLMWITTTPKGKNWVYDWYMMGLSDNPKYEAYESFHWETRDNPYFPAEEWDLAKADLPTDFFDQEYRAKFLDDMAGVFRGVKAIIMQEGDDHKPVAPFSMGVDLAKSVDWTVITVMDSTGRVVDWQRFNRIPWPEQKKIIARRWKFWHEAGESVGGCKIVMDSTGVGAPMYDELVEEIGDSRYIIPYTFTTVSKRNLVQALQSAVEHADIAIPNQEILIEEMDYFQYKITAHGNMTYSAPAGKNDDAVDSLALANWGKIYHLSSGAILIVDVFPEEVTVRDVFNKGSGIVHSGGDIGSRSATSMWGSSKAFEMDREGS